MPQQLNFLAEAAVRGPKGRAPPTTAPRPPQPQGTPEPTTPPQGRTGTTAPQTTPQAQGNPYLRYYETLSDQDLLKEQNRLRHSDPGGMSVITAHRLAAVTQVLSARQHAAERKTTQGHDAPQPPPQATPQEAINHYRTHYQNYSTDDLQKEANRLQLSDPFAMNVPTSLKLSVINTILTQRQNVQTPRPTAPGLPQEPE